MGFTDLFSSDFKKAIPALAQENNWKVTEIADDRAVLEFATAGGRTQTLYILKYPATLEFSVPSAAIYNSVDEIADHLATQLLKRNNALQIGFWALEEIQGKWVFSVMYNEELSRLHAEKFGNVVSALVADCDTFER